MSTIEELERKECCGCSSCIQKCPTNAISMVANKEGFLYPIIDKEKCINCGLCARVCPQLKNMEKNEDIYPKAYAMRNHNKNDLKKSSSGGIFSVIAKYVIENNGVVFGAAYNDDLDVNHIKVENERDLNLLRSSKYVQSNINNTYKEAEKELKLGKIVFFTGTPCQIAGLKAFLVNDYDNLITADLVCHGVPSQKLFHTYIDYLSKKFGSKVLKYNFRSKEKKGWGLVSKVETEDGKIRFIEPDFDPYYSNFLESNTYRESCYVCHYTNCNRVSNITLADYWGVNGIHPKFYNEDGNSLILINDFKGEQLLKTILNKVESIETDISLAVKHNNNLVKPSHRSSIRNEIYNGIYDKSPEEFIKDNLKVKITLKKILKTIIPIGIKKKMKRLKGFIKNDKGTTFSK